MQSFTNRSRIRQYARIARVLAFGGLGLMGVAVLISLRQPYPVELVFGLLLVGMLTSQIGLPLRNRWDREPRFDQVLDEHLKGLDKRYTIFHYYLGASHVLICPAGTYALVPRLEDGEISYQNGRWQRTMARRGLLRRGGTRHIRGIEHDAERAAQRAQRALVRQGIGDVEVEALLVFLHRNAAIQPEQLPILASHVKKLKVGLRKLPKRQTPTPEQVQALQAELGIAV